MRDPSENNGLIEVALEPVTAGRWSAFTAALEALVPQHPPLRFSVDHESQQAILKGPSESELGAAAAALSQLCGFAINIGAPQVAYRETLKKAVGVDYTHKRQMGAGEFARVKIAFAPLARGAGYAFEKTAGDAVPELYLDGVTRGIDASRQNGVLAGFPLIDFKATLLDGAYHEVDSNERTFEIAARAAFRDLKRLDAVKLLEPIMTVEITTPLELGGDVVSDLTARRGRILNIDQRGDAQVVTALAPLAELLGYEKSLLRITRGRGSLSMRFAHYDDAPDDDPGRFPPAAALRG